MAADSTKVTTTWLDKFGKACRIVFFISKLINNPSDPIITALIALYKGVTGAEVQQSSLSIAQGYTASSTLSTYGTVQDKALITFEGAESHFNDFIPGPKSTVFDTDTITLKAASTPLSTYIAAVLANAVGEGGEALTGFGGGHRFMRRKLNKK